MFDYSLSANFLKKCQVMDHSEIHGTVCPWVLGEGEPAREDLHDTLQAVYVWSRPENLDDSRENLELSIDYVKRKFDWYKTQDEPMKSYDSIYYILALKEYLKTHSDKELVEIEEYALNYLVEFFKKSPKHNSREYSNPYWKASILKLVLDASGKSADFLSEWLKEDLTLIKPEKEEVHHGKGYVHPHDFFSTFGTKLMAINLLLQDHDYARLAGVLPGGYVKRSIDETSFNASLLFGLCTLKRNDSSLDTDHVERVKEEIFNTLEGRFVEGGTRRGDYVKIRESWSTFFVYFAELLRDGEKII